MKISRILEMWKQAKACTPTLVSAGLLVSAFPAAAVQVTFQVNMEVQATTGNFNPSTHTVELHGSFDGWGPGITLSVSPTNTSVYQGTVDIMATAGSTVEYKYVINQAGTLVWEGNVGPGGASNRQLTVPASDQTLAVVYFNNQSTPPGVVAVTFQVNMQIQRELGNFDPETHPVEVHGSFDNWSAAGVVLSPDPTDADVYQGTVNITGSAGTGYEYKYVINKPGGAEWEGNVGPGGPFGNRVFNLAAGSSQTLPLVYFNNVTNNPGAGIAVTFQANMVVQYVPGLFDPATGVVDVRGPFNNWGNPPYVLTNSPSNPYLFVGTLSVSNASPGNTVPYKFNMNGTWEGGNDRTFVLASAAQTIPPRYFDDLSHLGPVTMTRGPLPDEMTVSWTGYPHARLQSAADLVNPTWEDVPNTEGQSSTTVFFLDPEMKFFRVTGP